MGLKTMNVLHMKYAATVARLGSLNRAEVDKYGREALEKTITDAVSILK